MEPTKRYTIKNIWAREKGIPATFIAVVTRPTERAVRLTGQGTLDARGQCMVCGRELTHPVSILTGIGPECGKHFWDESVLGPYGFTEAHAEKLKQMALNVRFKDVWLPRSAIKSVDDTDEVVQIEEEKTEEKVPEVKRACLNGSQIEIRFPFDIKTVAEVKTKIEGRRWEPNQKIWKAPATLNNAKMLKELEYQIDEGIQSLIDEHSEERFEKISLDFSLCPLYDGCRNNPTITENQGEKNAKRSLSKNAKSIESSKSKLSKRENKRSKRKGNENTERNSEQSRMAGESFESNNRSNESSRNKEKTLESLRTCEKEARDQFQRRKWAGIDENCSIGESSIIAMWVHKGVPNKNSAHKKYASECSRCIQSRLRKSRGNDCNRIGRSQSCVNEAKEKRHEENESTRSPWVDCNTLAALLTLKIIPGLKTSLYPFQIQDVLKIDAMGGNSLIASEMGLGKTIQALAWLEIHPEVRPAVIIVPASLKLNWKKEINQWMSTKRNVYICNGRTVKSSADFAGFDEADLFVINYDILTDWWIDQFKKAGVQAMVLDESHSIKNSGTKRTKAVKKLHRIVKHTIALSGTPITNRPIEFYTTIKLLAPQLFGSRLQYATQFCDAKNNGFGWDFTGSKNTEQLHDILTSSIMVRRLKKDVLKELPAKVISVVPMEITNRITYQKAEDNFIKYLKEIDPKKAKAAERAQALVEIEGLKQLTIAGKIKACKEWIKDHIETNGKLVVFCTHKNTIDMLMEEFGDIAVKLDGSTKQADRQTVVDQFQNDDKIRLFVGNIKAAGVGITLTAASSVAFLELDWTPGAHVQAEDRIHRIGQEAESCNIYYLLADRTIENDIASLLDQKRKILDSVLDGIDTEEESLLSELLNIYREG